MAYIFDARALSAWMADENTVPFVLVEVPGIAEAYPFPVILVFEDGVGIVGPDGYPEAWRLSPPDLDGDCFLKVPASAIRALMTEDDAEAYASLLDASGSLHPSAH